MPVGMLRHPYCWLTYWPRTIRTAACHNSGEAAITNTVLTRHTTARTRSQRASRLKAIRGRHEATANTAKQSHIAVSAFCGVVADISVPRTVTVVPPVTAIAAATAAATQATASAAPRNRRRPRDDAVCARLTATASVQAIA